MMNGLDGPPDIVLSQDELHRAIGAWLDRTQPRPEGAQSYDIRLTVKVTMPTMNSLFSAEVWYSEKPNQQEQITFLMTGD